MLKAINKELVLRKKELSDEKIGSIYFGGGTPSLLSIDELQFLIDCIYKNFQVNADAEITLEANPDDLSLEKIKELSEYSKRKEEISIDLTDEKIIFGNSEIKFNIDPFKKKCLLEFSFNYYGLFNKN